MKRLHAVALSCVIGLLTTSCGRDIYYFINTTAKPVSTEVTLRGKVFRPEFWNPHYGSITKIGNAEYAVNPTDGIWRTRIRLELAPSRSVFIVSGNYPLKNMFQQSIT
ncbi:MAG: hypothetical protein J6B62_10880 [Bacteroidales bacterium]|nr:hypothetical protein [Bacteroidales bacterium]